MYVILTFLTGRTLTQAKDPSADSCDDIKCSNYIGLQHLMDVGAENTTQTDVNVGEDSVRNRFGRGAKSGSIVDKSGLHKSTTSLSTGENIPSWMQETLQVIIFEKYRLHYSKTVR